MANVVGKLDINRNGALLTTVDIDKSTVFTEEIPGTRLINCPIATQAVLNLKENDYVLFDDEPLSINIIPDIEVDGASPSDKYTITFEAEFYKLLDTYVKNDQGKRTFTKYGTAADHLETLIASAGNGWHVVQVDSTEEFLLDYNDTYIRGGLNMIAEAAGLEWDAFYKGITMRKTIGRDTGLVFEVGRGKGLHKIKRSPDASKSVITRLYGKGGTRNITSKYRDGAQTNLIIEGEYIQTAGVTAGTERVKEGTYTNEKIFPHFKGVVGAVTVAKNNEGVVTSFTIVDTAINFNINSQLQEGVKAKVGFLTGALTGIEFEVESYNASTKVLVLIPNKDTNNYITPNDLNLPEVGDKWTVYDIIMPDAYFATSEAELRAEMVTYLEENRFQNLIFDTKPSPKYLRDNQIRLRGGDTVKAVQAAIGVNEILRFIKISFPLVDRFDVTGTIGNKIVYSEVTKLFADVLNTTKQVQQIDRRAAIIAKRNSQNLKVLADSIFDADGNFDATKFNVGVLSALLGIFGLQSSDFLLSKVFITANFGGDINAVNISAGELIHLEYTHGGTDNIWQMQPITQSGLVAGSKYYVYSKISTTSNAGTFIITTDQLKPNDNPGFYTLRTGIIYPVNGGYRDADFTYGITTINGRQIKTGIIEGNTGALSLNLDTGEIFGKLTFRSANGTIKDVATVDNKAALADANALAAQITADNANVQASAAIAELLNITDDGVLDVSEKQTALKDWRAIEAERDVIGAQANIYSISTVDFTNKYNALNSYLTPLFANMSVNSDIDRQAFISGFVNYYTSRQNLLKAITEAAKTKTDQAQETASDAIADATDAQINAAIALAELADIADDGILDVSEKQSAYQDWQNIQGEVASVQAQANAYAVSLDDYNAKLNTLTIYANTLFAEMSVNTPIDRMFFINTFKAYYSERQNVYTAVTNATKGLIQNISVGGRNYYSRNTILTSDSIDILNKDLPQHGFGGLAANTANQGTVRLNGVVKSNGVWTISGFVTTNQSWNLLIDICDSPSVVIPLQANVTKYFSATIDVTNYHYQGNADYEFVDFSGFPNVYFNFTDVKVEKGSTPTGWTTAPEDLQADLDAAIAKGNEALTQISMLADDSILDPSEKATVLKDVREIQEEANVIGAQANTYQVSTVDFTAKYNALLNYVLPMLADMTSNTYIDRTVFISRFTEYNTAKITVMKNVSDAANGRISAAVVSANAYADSVAQSKANIAQAAAIGAASTDASNKSTVAYNNAVSTSNAYAATVANTASSAAQIAAAADASNKATAAFNNAEANRIAQYNSLTSALKPLAYQEFVALSQLGDSIVENGKIKTVLLEAQGIWANIINAGITNTQQLYSTSGTIGGWTISPYALSGSNGGTTIELNVTNNDPFFQVTAANGSFTKINYQGIRTTYNVCDDILIKRALFIDADHIFIKNGTDSNGDSSYGGRVGDYGSNGFAFLERNGGNLGLNLYNLTASNWVTGNNVRYQTLTNLSDIRFKKNIKPLKYGLKELVKLEPIKYKYKFPKSDRMQDASIHMGFSAQAVKQVIPELVMDGDRLSISMIELIPVMINAIKELHLEINNLKLK